jgi:glycosyltransferase involved in cell wall biosynthesis
MAEKKRILLFTDWYTPGYKAGGPIQSCQNIVSTLGTQYEFHVLTSDRDLGAIIAYPDIPSNEWINGGKERIFYAAPGFMQNRNIRNLIKQIEPDIIYFNSMFSPRYTLLPLWILRELKYTGKIVLAPRGMLKTGALNVKPFKKKIFLQLFRWSGFPGKIVFHATNEQEKEEILQHFPRARHVQVIANIPHIDIKPPMLLSKSAGELRMVYIARIHPIKNLDYILKVLGKTFHGKIQFDIYGEGEDVKYIQQCQLMAAQLPEQIQVRFHGPIAHKDVFDILYQYHLFVLPTLGENFGHSIFEALSAARPVLISDKTPWRQLKETKAGWDIPLEEMNAYQAAIQQVLDMNQEEFNNCVQGARNYATQFLESADLTGKYSALFQ